MSFGRVKKTGPWADGEKGKARPNPVLQSSIEYDTFLQAKLYPRGESVPTAPSRPRRGESPPVYVPARERRVEGGPRTAQRAPGRPAWAVLPAAPAPAEAERKLRGAGAGSIPVMRSEDKEARQVPPLQHSWRRHVAPERAVPAAVAPPPAAGTFDFSKVPKSPAEVAALMSAAQSSIDMSRQREQVISGLLRESSRGEQERLQEERQGRTLHHHDHHQQQQDASFLVRASQESEDGSAMDLSRTVNLARAFRLMGQAAKAQREGRKRQELQLRRGKQDTLKRRYLRAWKETARRNAHMAALQQRKLQGAFSQWVQELQRSRHTRILADQAFVQHTRIKVMRRLREVVQEGKASKRQAQWEYSQERTAVQARDQSLLRSAFIGLRKAARVDAGQRELEEESALRRMRIAALMSTMAAAPAAPAEAKASRTPDDERKGAAARRRLDAKGGASPRNGAASRITVSPRSRATQRGDEEMRPALSPRMLVLPLGADSKDSFRGRPVAVQRGFGADAKDTRPTWQADAKAHGRNTVSDNKPVHAAGNSRSLLDSGADADEPPPPAYSSAATTRTPHYLSSTAAAAGQRHGRADGKAASGVKGPSEAVAAADAKLTQQELDDRASLRRGRLTELSHTARQRVRGLKEQDEERARLQKQREDEDFARSQEEHRREQLVSKTAVEEKARQEAELRRKMKMSVAHGTRAVLIRAGFGPWQRLMVQCRLDWAKAMYHRDDTLVQQAWIALYGYCMSSRSERARREYRQSSMAKAHYYRGLLRGTWRRWLLSRRLTRAKAVAVTGHFSRYTVNRRAFGAWRLALERIRRQEVQQIRAVVPRGKRSVQRHFFAKWMEFHRDALLDREISNRTDLTWQKVQAWL